MTEKMTRAEIEHIATFGAGRGRPSQKVNQAITQLLAELDAAQADRANALRAGWMMGGGAAAGICTRRMPGTDMQPTLPVYDDGYSIASVIRSLTPPDGDEVQWTAKVLLAHPASFQKMVDVAEDIYVIGVSFNRVIADALRAIAGGGK